MLYLTNVSSKSLRLKRSGEIKTTMIDLMIFFSGGIFLGLSMILTKMGTTITKHDIDIQHPWLFVNVVAHHYILDPSVVLLLSILLRPPVHQIYGMFVVALTPATASASVLAYSVNGNVPLAIVLSMTSLISSVVLTPLGFSMLVRIYSQFSNKLDDNTISLPYLRMAGIMIYVLFCVGSGYKMNELCSVTVTNKLRKICNRLGAISMLFAFSCYFASESFIKSMNAKNPILYFGSMVIITYTMMLTSYFPVCGLPENNKDTAAIVNIARSPGISIAIAALSFQKSKYYGEIVGYTLVYGMIRDWCTMPCIMFLRKRRMGYYVYKNNKLEEKTDVVDI